MKASCGDVDCYSWSQLPERQLVVYHAYTTFNDIHVPGTWYVAVSLSYLVLAGTLYKIEPQLRYYGHATHGPNDQRASYRCRRPCSRRCYRVETLRVKRGSMWYAHREERWKHRVGDGVHCCVCVVRPQGAAMTLKYSSAASPIIQSKYWIR